MSKAKARILARCIYRGSKTIEDVDEQYLLLFGEELT